MRFGSLPIPTVMCLHSGTQSPRQWDALRERLRGRYRVLAPALYGHGGGVPLPLDRTLTLADEARLVEAVIDGAGAVHLIGHSYGAAVALKVATRRASRLLSLTLFEPILRHVLWESAPDHGALADFAYVRGAVQHAARSGRPEQAAQTVVDYWSGRGAWSRLSAKARASFIGRLPILDANFAALYRERTPLAEYARIGAPALFLVGANSPFASKRVTSLLGTTLPRATVRELEGAGHMGPLSHAREVNPVIEAYLDERQAQMGHAPGDSAGDGRQARAA